MPTEGNSESKHTVKRSSLSECKPLMEAAGTDLFRSNAFRTTGLPVDAATREITRHADKLKVMEELGHGGSAHTSAFALDPPPTIDQISESIQKLKDPERRIIEEFFWFWPEQFGESHSDPAIQALTKGDSKTPIEIWTSKEDDSVEGVVALHNLALTYHLTALDWEYFAVGNELEPERRTKITTYWREAFKRWDRLAVDERLWEKVNARIRQIDDARLTTGFARRMRSSLPLALDKINAELALKYAEKGKLDLARLHVQFMRETNKGLDDVDKTADTVLGPTTGRLREQIQRAKRRTENTPADGAIASKELLEHAERAVVHFDPFFGKNSEPRTDLFDEVASACNQLLITYQKATGDDKICLDLLNSVLALASSSELRKQIEENISTLNENIEFKNLEALFALLRSIQEGQETPRLKLERFRREASGAITSAASHLNPGSGLSAEINNAAAMVLRNISIDAWNKFQDKKTAQTAHTLAVSYARSVDLKQQLDKDQSHLNNILIQPRNPQTVIQNRNPKPSSNKSGQGWLVALGIVGLLVAIGSCNSSKHPASDGNYPRSPNSPVQGTYRIPRNMQSELTRDRQAIENAKSTAGQMQSELAQMSRQIESQRANLDDTSQYAIDAFNRMVGRYNEKLGEARSQDALVNQMVETYNDKLRRYGR